MEEGLAVVLATKSGEAGDWLGKRRAEYFGTAASEDDVVRLLNRCVAVSVLLGDLAGRACSRAKV